MDRLQRRIAFLKIIIDELIVDGKFVYYNVLLIYFLSFFILSKHPVAEAYKIRRSLARISMRN